MKTVYVGKLLGWKKPALYIKSNNEIVVLAWFVNEKLADVLMSWVNNDKDEMFFQAP